MLSLATLFERHSGDKASRSHLCFLFFIFFRMLLANWSLGIVLETSDLAALGRSEA